MDWPLTTASGDRDLSFAGLWAVAKGMSMRKQAASAAILKGTVIMLVYCNRPWKAGRCYHRSVPSKRLRMRESVIRRTTILSQQLGAVNLSQGFPDDDTFPELKQLAVEAIAGCNHQYTDPWGSPVLRRALAKNLREFNGTGADPDRNIVITCGATEGMIVAMEALIERGSELITFAPMYENYVLQSIASGLELKTLVVSEPDFTFSRRQLEKLRTPRTAAVLLCNPCNPTGKVFTREELGVIAGFAADHDLLIFCDETYEYLTWPGQ